MTKMAKKTSEARSFSGWDVLRMINGRKKTAITIVGTILGYFIGDGIFVGALTGGIIEIVYGTIEFYLKQVKLE